jgi:hypothetical protein
VRKHRKTWVASSSKAKQPSMLLNEEEKKDARMAALVFLNYVEGPEDIGEFATQLYGFSFLQLREHGLTIYTFAAIRNLRKRRSALLTSWMNLWKGTDFKLSLFLFLIVVCVIFLLSPA